MKKLLWILVMIAILGVMFWLFEQPNPSPTTNAGVGNGTDLTKVREIALGQKTDDIPCEAGEMLTFHIHAHLDVIVNGQKATVPAGIGIGTPWSVDPTGFVTGGSCFSWLHTHDTTGVIHIEAPGEQSFTLGQFFDMWGIKFDNNCIGASCQNDTSKLHVYLNGKTVDGDPRTVKLSAHDEIAVIYGTDTQQSTSIPSSYNFPNGL